VLYAHLSIRAWRLCASRDGSRDRQQRRQRERAGKQ
jgi:hypothetical protein